jgi:hypothetical protein
MMIVPFYLPTSMFSLCLALPMIALFSPPGTADRGGYLEDLD